jgi:hypothetical protein
VTAPTFGNVDDLDRPTFGTRPGAITHRCIAALGFDCPGPAPHLPPAKPDPATVPAFPDLEPTPSLWSVEPARPAPAPEPERVDYWQDVHAPTIEPIEPEPAPAFVITTPAGHVLERIPARCPVRWSDTQEGPLYPCRLPAGHSGKHE